MKTKLITALALSGALTLAGCSGSGSGSGAGGGSSSTGGGSSASGSSTSAPTKTDDAKAGGGTVDAKEFGTNLTNAMVDAKSGKASMKLDMSGAAGATPAPGLTGAMDMTMEFVYNAKKQMNMHATINTGAQKLEMVVVDGVSYMKSPTPIGGKAWLKLPASQALTDAADPLAVAKGFEGATVKLVDEKDGLKHYTVSGIAGEQGAMDVYVDGDGRPARMAVNAAGAKVNAEYTDWGAAVTVTAPPADQVAQMPGGGAG